jgi:hypothetical protein
MEKFIRFGNIEVEIFPKDEYYFDYRRSSHRKSWEESKDDLSDRGLRLPTVKELSYIRGLLYLNHGGNFDEGREYWTSEIYDRGMEGSDLEAHKTINMSYQSYRNNESSSKYNYSRMGYRGVRDI